ncbi:hypothetical protein ACIP6X_21445 [Streptomyces coeruleorubidus]|uniref:hypothetical protein n=1 Tax=Streptomyces coeruleorubidus TaxID=116188 RepID=UPI00381B5D22
MTVGHRIRDLPGRFGGGAAGPGLLSEDADPVAGQVLHQPCVQPVQLLLRRAVLPRRPGQAARGTVGGRLAAL